ncbi:MAG: hypothetical protein AAF235_07395 [Planctomycetota bacterium]
MRRLIPWVWIVCGIGMMTIGIGRAVGELAQTYRGLLDDALAEPEVSEKARAGRMLGHAALGAAGVLPLGIGGVLLVRQKARKKRAGRPHAAAPRGM